MKTKYKYIYFYQDEDNKSVYYCRNIKSDFLLGQLAYYPRWRSYVFAAESSAIWSASCLADIIDFMKQL